MVRASLATDAQHFELTTNRAPFIDGARREGRLYIEQPYQMYSRQNHSAWQRLYQRMQERWDRYGNATFKNGISRLCFDPDRVPRLRDVNQFLAPLTGFQARAVSGYIPAYHFFDCLRRREFPTTITIRDERQLDYLPEPDIFHDIAGHVPMHTDPAFADTLVRFGECAHEAAEMAREVTNPEEQIERATSVIKAMARFFWFTVEFGLIREQGGLKGLGSGLLSSYGELAHAVDAPNVQRYPLQLNWVVNQAFAIDRYQPLLFYVESLDQLYEMVGELIAWVRNGRLNNVAPGEPGVSHDDLKSFLEGTTREAGMPGAVLLSSND